MDYRRQAMGPRGHSGYPSNAPIACRPGATPEDVEEFITRLELDASAADAMRSLPAPNAVGIMEQISDNVKNKSAFATTAARRVREAVGPDADLQSGEGGMPRAEDDPEASAELVDEMIVRLELDDRARAALQSLAPQDAMRILEDVSKQGGDVRNCSAFAFTAAKKLLGAASMEDMAARSAGAGVKMEDMEAEVEGIIRQMRLDDRAAGILHEVPLEKAMDILGELRKQWSAVRNPSAYVFNACAKEINSPGSFVPSGMRSESSGADRQPLPPPPVPFEDEEPVPEDMDEAQLPVEGLEEEDDMVRSEKRKQVERAILRWKLDEVALKALLEVTPDQALDILNSIDVNVRNPSAFVTTAARKRATPDGVAAVNGGENTEIDRAAIEEQVEETIRSLGIDERAAGKLHEVPLEEAMDILQELQRKFETIRNPSAYVFNAASKFQEKAAMAPPAPPPVPSMPSHMGFSQMERYCEGLMNRIGLDESAKASLQSIPLEHAKRILDQVTNNVRNPSAFCVTMAQRVLQQMHHGGGGGMPGPMPGRGGGRGAPAPPALSRQQMEERAERMAREMGIDENSLTALQTIPLENAMHLLQRLRESWSSVRNPSAFITAGVKDYRQGGGGERGSPGGGMSSRAQAAKQLDQMIARFGMDKAAMEAMASVGPEEALALLHSIDANIRNPSAWVTHAIRTGQHKRIAAHAGGFNGGERGMKRQMPAAPAAPAFPAAPAAPAASADDEAVAEPQRKVAKKKDDMPWAKWDLRTWLYDIDDGTGLLNVYADTISSEFDTVEQLIEIYQGKTPAGKLTLNASFFTDVGVEDEDHKKLFLDWFDSHLN